MFTIILFTSLGAYVGNRSTFVRNAEKVTLSIDYLQIWRDLVKACLLIIWLKELTIEQGQKTRSFVDTKVLPLLPSKSVVLDFSRDEELDALTESY